MKKAQEYSDGIANEVLKVEQALADQQDFDWFEMMLDVEYTVNLNGEVRKVSLLRTTGGPLCTIEFVGDGTAYVETRWGHDTGWRSVWAPYLEASAFEFVDIAMSGGVVV